jgi:3-hydroxybutyryl-CoA dehydrogenase
MEIKTIAIVGAANLGRRIAYEAARAGYRAILEDVSPVALEQGIARIAQALANDVAAGRIQSTDRVAALANDVAAGRIQSTDRVAALANDVAAGRIQSTDRVAALANLTTAASAEDASREADLIIEAVADEMEVKIELFTIFDKFAKPGAIFASTTTSLSVSEMADVTFCPERCIGMRFFADAQNANRLELVKGRETSEQTVAACREVGRRMGNQVLVTSDVQVLNTSADD